MITNISSKFVKARKDYYCNYSRKLIKKGEEYKREVNVYDGEIYTFRTCKEAIFLISELDLYGRGTDGDGFSDTDYEEMLMDYISDNDLYDVYENGDESLHDFVYSHMKDGKKK